MWLELLAETESIRDLQCRVTNFNISSTGVLVVSKETTAPVVLKVMKELLGSVVGIIFLSCFINIIHLVILPGKVDEICCPYSNGYIGGIVSFVKFQV